MPLRAARASWPWATEALVNRPKARQPPATFDADALLESLKEIALEEIQAKGREEAMGDAAEIAEKIELSFKSTSRHLSQLAGLDIVSKDQRGLFMYYNLSKKHLPLVKFVLSYTSNSHE